MTLDEDAEQMSPDRLRALPPGEYSRVTNPERFAPLHRFALDLLERLQAGLDAERVEGEEPDPGQGLAQLARPSVKLTPSDSKAAPIVVSFTIFPGVIVRCGRWLALTFPACGCDACAETADGEQRRLMDVIDDVVGGRFRESIRIPLLGAAEQRWELWSSTHRMGGRARIPRSRARALVNADSRKLDWSPWPPR